MFQLLNYPLSFREFNKGSASINSNKSYFNFTDSLTAYEKLNPLNEYASSFARIEKNGTPNKMTNTKLSQLKMEIEIINQDKDSALYNNAVSDYNAAINTFNDFINYRNNQFKPVKTETEVQSMFNAIENYISSARKNLAEVNKSKAVLMLNTGDVEYAVNNLSTKVKEQQAFLRNYLSTSKNK
jgi:phage host-nuclease inhibitor protein Gam